MAAWSKSIIDRPLTVRAGKLGAEADLAIAHVSLTVLGMTSSATSEGLLVGAEYGVNDKLAVGGSYGFSLHSFEIKGTLDLYGAYQLMHSDKLDIGASVDLGINLNSTDAMGNSSTTETLHAGVGVRYKVTPKIAITSGNTYAPGPLGTQLSIGFQSGAPKTLAIPVGVAFQATPELYAFLDTTILDILLSDVPMGGSRVNTIADSTPIHIGAFFNVNKNIDVGGVLGFPDVQHAGDFYTILLGARYYN